MISDEALDAAVDALVASKLGDHKGINGEDFVEAARAALEAAAPYLMADAWDEGEQAGGLNLAGEECPGSEPIFNPYRSQS